MSAAARANDDEADQERNGCICASLYRTDLRLSQILNCGSPEEWFSLVDNNGHNNGLNKKMSIIPRQDSFSFT